MNAKRHAALARQLIAACGGLVEAASACRMSPSSLGRFCDPGSGQYMPADVMADLEAYAGEPNYSRAMCECRPAHAQALGLLTETFETTELAAIFQTTVREALADGRISREEDAAIEAIFLRLEGQIRELRVARERGEP